MNGQPHGICHLPGVALVGIVFTLVVFVAAPVARPDLNLLRNALSYYAIGPWGALQAAAFAAMGIASMALGMALISSGAESIWLRVTVSMLVVGGMGSLGLVVYPMGTPGPATVLGDTHQTAGTVGGVAQLAAALAFVLAIRADPRWRGGVMPATIAFVVAVLGAILTQAAIWWPELGIPMGAVMRLAVVPLVVLWGLVAFRLRQRCRHSPNRSVAAR